jgi:hypothetical protein
MKLPSTKLIGFLMMLALLTGITTVAHADATLILQSSYQNSTSITPDEINTFHGIVQNTTGSSQQILLDLELYNANNQKIAQQFYDAQTIEPYNVINQTLRSPPHLPPGSYAWKVGIFNPGWNGLIAWYDNPLTFSVTDRTQDQTGDVTLNTAVLGEFHYNNCPPITALLSNSSSNSRNILLDIELRNSHSELVDQYFTDNVSVAGNQSLVPVTNNCSRTLPDDIYNYSIGIFNPQWNGLVHWYNNVRSFTVATQSGTSTPTTTTNVQMVRIDRPKENPPVGASFNIIPMLISPNESLQGVQVRVYLTEQVRPVEYTVTYSNQDLPQNAEKNFTLHIDSIKSGAYQIQIAVLDANGNTLQTFQNVGGIVVP